MPPKKQVAEQKLLLGRPGNNLKMGIVGMPNVGKSTFFNALTNSSVAAENYPFCTIDPEESRVAVPDERFDWLCDKFKPASKVPAALTVIDIAGLVKGASAGAGLGNAFLSHIRAVDGIFHMCRAFSDGDITHVEGEVDPIRDLEIIHQELRLKDSEFLKKHLEGLEAQAKRAGKNMDKTKVVELETVRKLTTMVCDDNKDVRLGDWNNKEIEVINQLQLLTAKPVIYLVNLSESDYIRRKNKWLAKIKAWVEKNSSVMTAQPDEIFFRPPIIPFSVKLEHHLTTLPETKEKEDYLKMMGESFLEDKDKGKAEVKSMLSKIVNTGYNVLQLIYFFTAGPDEVRAWTIRKGTKAPQAAGVIHSDFERGFIMAETMKFEDLKELGTEAAVKGAGKYFQKGKEYVVEDGDIIFFKFNVSSAKKK
jgi:obg-like ATPase 1